MTNPRVVARLQTQSDGCVSRKPTSNKSNAVFVRSNDEAPERVSLDDDEDCSLSNATAERACAPPDDSSAPPSAEIAPYRRRTMTEHRC
jgi:hypothetical protein